MDISVLLVTFEILSQCLKIDSSYWLQEDVQWITDKFFEKSLWFQMASTFSSGTSLMNFCYSPDFVVAFIVIRLVVMFYRPPMHDKHPHTPIEAYLSVFIDIRWNSLNLMAVKNLKIFFQIFFEHWPILKLLWTVGPSQYWQNPLAFYGN